MKEINLRLNISLARSLHENKIKPKNVSVNSSKISKKGQKDKTPEEVLFLKTFH